MVLIRDRRVPLLPNLITTGSIFAGFYSIIHSIHYDFRRAAWALVVAGVCDLLDGRIARLTKSQSEFGVQYDSLSDLCSFGFAPALLAYFWALERFGRLGWAVSFLYLVCAALRLARFNIQGSTEEKEYFQGIPSPGAAGVIIASVLFHQEIGTGGRLELMPARMVFLFVTFITALLMVSGVRYRTFKSINIRGVRPFQMLVLGALILFLVMISPEFAIFICGYTYLASGIIETVFFLRKGVREVLESDEDDEGKSTGTGADDGKVTLLPS